MKFVLFYEAADDVMTTAPQHFAAHSEWAATTHASGELLMIGTFEDPAADGAMAIFQSYESAEHFARNDPFVVNGVVKRWRISGWNEVLTS